MLVLLIVFFFVRPCLVMYFLGGNLGGPRNALVDAYGLRAAGFLTFADLNDLAPDRKPPAPTDRLRPIDLTGGIIIDWWRR